jgi:hypothetical protein
VTNEERNLRLIRVERDGVDMEIEFTRENGERLIGVYSLVCWARGPQALRAAFREAQRDAFKDGGSVVAPGRAGSRRLGPRAKRRRS